jgi:predicted membrane-bound spermidine synthase
LLEEFSLVIEVYLLIDGVGSHDVESARGEHSGRRFVRFVKLKFIVGELGEISIE